MKALPLLLVPLLWLLVCGTSLCPMDEALNEKIQDATSFLILDVVRRVRLDCRSVTSRGDLVTCPSDTFRWVENEYRQIGGPGKMETEEIYMNQVKMQAAAFKDKKRRSPDNKEGADDPAYENFTLTFRNRDQPKGSHSPAKNKVPSQSRPPLDSAQGLYLLHRAMVSLSLLLALSCVVLLALVLMKNSEMSQELLNLKGELQNVSLSAQGCLELQKEAWSTLNQSTRMAVQGINTLKNKVQEQSQKLLRGALTDLHWP
ncbi:mast cell-expressed membrane protein 1-like protein [Camelus ferus]|nr:mast cell-expressed membrane protein 1-like protein [Camelus ferus]